MSVQDFWLALINASKDHEMSDSSSKAIREVIGVLSVEETEILVGYVVEAVRK